MQIKDQQFPVVTYQEAMEKYGADRFDLRTAEDKERGVLAFAWVVNFPFSKKLTKPIEQKFWTVKVIGLLLTIPFQSNS